MIAVLAQQKMEKLLKLSKWHQPKFRECGTILLILLCCSASTVMAKHMRSCGGRMGEDI